MSLDLDLTEALTVRIMDTLRRQGIDQAGLRERVQSEVATVLRDVQHQIYQDAMSSLGRIAHDLSPKTARYPR